NGSVDLTVNGGVGPYSYNWSNGAVTEDLAAVAANTYDVTVTDANGCTATLSVTINNANGPALSETHIDAACGSANGSVDLTVNGGVGPYSYNWSNGAVTEDLAAVAANTYDVTVTDANGCTATLSVTINNANGPALSETHIDAACGSANGSVDLTVNGGVGPYSYNWSNGAVTEDLAAVAANTYDVTVTDANGCTATLSVTINNANGPALSETHIDAACGSANGSVDLTVNGGVGPYSYNWSNGAFTEDLAAVAANTYDVTVTDANGCTATLSVTINNANGPALSETHIDAACGSANGSVDLTVNGGVGPYSYNWGNGAVTEDLSNITAATYDVTVTDANGCTATLSVTINNANGPALSETHIDAACGSANGSVDLTVNGGVGPYSYNWGN